MAHYAKISNEEFTVNQRARISEIYKEIDIIKFENRASDGYIAVKNVLDAKTHSDTLIALKSDLNDLYAAYDIPNSPQQEEVDALKDAIQVEQDDFRAECDELFEQLDVLENEGTEALVAERESLEQEIKNSLCRVTKVLTGVDEIEMVKGEDAEIEAQIQALQESIDFSDVEQVRSVLQQIQDLQDSIPLVEKDNTERWEGFYGPSKRTSYNTSGGVHKNGGTPFRKNYAAAGHIYDPVRDAFYAEQPYPSWILNEDTCFWEPPVPRPEDVGWYWKEDTTEWVDYVYINETGTAPFDGWIWDTTEGKWKAPVDYPEDGGNYYWDENTLSWKNILENKGPEIYGYN